MSRIPKSIWMIDIAREQSPKLDHLYKYASHAQSAGFEGLGLYLEHRFRFPSTPWAHGDGSISPDQIASIQAEFPSLDIVPFINVLGHMGGFVSTVEGAQFRTSPNEVTIDPGSPGAREFVSDLVQDTLGTFASNLIHIGGDEPWILTSSEKISHDERISRYLAHYLPIIQMVESAGRTAAMWADPAIQYPDIAAALPESVILFDWRYFDKFEPVSASAAQRTFLCPAAHSFTAPWLHIAETEANIRDAVTHANTAGTGFCLTFWEANLGSIFESILPVANFAKAALGGTATDLVSTFEEVDSAGDFAQIMGSELPELGRPFAHENRRNPLRTRFFSHNDPFVATRTLASDLDEEKIQTALALCEKATQRSPSEPYSDAVIIARSLIEFMLLSSQASTAYESGDPTTAQARLAACRVACDSIERICKRAHQRTGASLADVHRTIQARRHIELVIKRIEQYGRRELGYLPAFDVITDLHFVPHEQGRWRLFNLSTYDG